MIGVLCLNLGTPDAPDRRSVARYLRQFLMDPRVIDIPVLLRFILVNFLIVPFRSRTSAEAYASIWTNGSPLKNHSTNIVSALQIALGRGYDVRLAMRYGNPAIPAEIARFAKLGYQRLIIVPLFPQYSTAAWGSAVAEVYRCLSLSWNTPSVSVVGPFFADQGFIKSFEAEDADHVLISFHGLPERHIKKSDVTCHECLVVENCCQRPGSHQNFCYRAHCYSSARAIAESFKFKNWSVAFQSRLGRDPWLRPFTDQEVIRLAKEGVRRLHMLSPSFTADCLETTEELGVRAREEFLKHGGLELTLSRCPNDHPNFVNLLAAKVAALAFADK